MASRDGGVSCGGPEMELVVVKVALKDLCEQVVEIRWVSDSDGFEENVMRLICRYVPKSSSHLD